MPLKPFLRAALLVAVPALGACSTTVDEVKPLALAPLPELPPDPRAVEYYSALPDGERTIPGISPDMVNPRNIRQLVDFDMDEPPGTVVVDPFSHFLYLVEEGGKAMRYGVGVGKEGFEFKGTASIARKAAWPRWTPTPGMIEREPERYGPHAGGVEGGLGNPLGARAMYLHKDGKDTLFRIHGTNEPWTIGQSVSSGCIRMVNQDVIDLERRVPVGAKVIVLEKPYEPGASA